MEQARELVSGMQESNHPLGEKEACYVIQYAFYADDFTKVTRLAVELSRRGYELEHGTMDEEFLEPYHTEINQKKEYIKKFVSISEQAAKMLEEGTRLFAEMQGILTELGLGKIYGDYMYQQAEEKRHMGKEQKQETDRQRKGISEEGGNRKCQR